MLFINNRSGAVRSTILATAWLLVSMCRSPYEATQTEL